MEIGRRGSALGLAFILRNRRGGLVLNGLFSGAKINRRLQIDTQTQVSLLFCVHGLLIRLLSPNLKTYHFQNLLITAVQEY